MLTIAPEDEKLIQDRLDTGRYANAEEVREIALFTLDDDVTPCDDYQNAKVFTSMDILTSDYTPNLFPDLMAAAIYRRDLSQWIVANLSD